MNNYKAKTIVIVGAGQLGSRYLQGLSLCKIPLKIFIIDPNGNSLLTAKMRWNQAVNHETNHQVHFFKKFRIYLML